MNDEPIHGRASELLAPYASGELEGRDRDELEAHLGSCADCRAELRALEVLRGPTGDGLTADERDRLRAEVWQAVHPAPVVQITSKRARAGRRVAQVLGAAAVIALLAVSAVYLGTGSGGGDAGSGVEGSADEESGRAFPRDAPEAESSRGGGQAAAGAPSPMWETPPEDLSPESLRRLSRKEPLRSFSAYSTRDAEKSGRNFLGDLADKAPDRATARTVEVCGRAAVTRERALPAVATVGRIEGRKVVALGYARGEGAGLLDRFMIVVFEVGRCGPPIRRLDGSLPPP